jgi:hypothetical protein
LAAACFVKVYGVAFLGQARSRHVRRARPVPFGMDASQGLLAALCLVFGVLPTWAISVIDLVPQQILGHGLSPSATQGWLWLTPLASATASYSPLLITVLFAAIAGLAVWALRFSTVRRVRRCDAWDCGFVPPTARMQYTATAFAQPIRRVFGLLFHVEEAVMQPAEGGGGAPRYHLRVSDRVWELLYTPVARGVESAARRVVRLQSGNVRVYLGWTLATLLALLWIIS